MARLKTISRGRQYRKAILRAQRLARHAPAANTRQGKLLSQTVRRARGFEQKTLDVHYEGAD